MWRNDYRLRMGISVILAGLIVVVVNLIQGDLVFAIGLLVVLGALVSLLLWSIRRSAAGPHLPHAAAGDDDVIIYWRPG